MSNKVNIVYPAEGGVYPVTGPTGSKSTYFTASFGITCDGDFNAEWGFDKQPIGKGLFYDQMSAQFVFKLSGGDHIFWVKAENMEEKVKFTLQ
ncbi:MAG: hypothetical protein KAW12_17885 [Candidatus Aminicenantes bacterium]|nr:hypothetical protein [Candidatus Aminicenantes bacterium]